MNREYYSYLEKLHRFVEAQDKRIVELEKKVKGLSDELKDVRAQPPVQVGTIEYKFDQLKVETLEGTLNIGLNPANPEGIEDFEVQNKNISTSFPMKTKWKPLRELEQKIEEYLDKDLNSLIKEYEEQLQINVDDSYIDFIKNDIKKQLPGRLDHYLAQIPEKERSAEASQKMTDGIVEQMKKDIGSAVFVFLNNLSKESTRKDDE
ncbi:germination protein PC [Robertmurraya siralis]|uniref:Germination protein PC n=1 Tax=Robertmurraya siralis TaxID=77777 RepID=A0A919WJ43_9BACI|nr:spore germination protein GerPC [Robertmurraya siralis]PAE20777.1 spore gernimation protein [Bacillus sp. 7504-2]GIN62905.1 germination protein PC [Robertmurraya siralis]